MMAGYYYGIGIVIFCKSKHNGADYELFIIGTSYVMEIIMVVICDGYSRLWNMVAICPAAAKTGMESLFSKV